MLPIKPKLKVCMPIKSVSPVLSSIVTHATANIENVSHVPITYQYIGSEHFEIDIKPYRHIVISKLNKTQLKVELRQLLEHHLYKKAINDAEKLRCGRNFDLFKSLYLSICRHLIVNLQMSNGIGCQQFIDNINNESLDIEIAINMTPQDMHPDRWRVLVEKKHNNIEKSTQDPEATTDMFWCGKCHRNKCKYFERQDRSADEPMTIHITCCYCGNRWKQ